MIRDMTTRRRKILREISQRSPVVARWDHVDLSWLQGHGLVKCQRAFVPAGGWSTAVVWQISQKGIAFLADERAGF